MSVHLSKSFALLQIHFFITSFLCIVTLKIMPSPFTLSFFYPLIQSHTLLQRYPSLTTSPTCIIILSTNYQELWHTSIHNTVNDVKCSILVILSLHILHIFQHIFLYQYYVHYDFNFQFLSTSIHLIVLVLIQYYRDDIQTVVT